MSSSHGPGAQPCGSFRKRRWTSQDMPARSPKSVCRNTYKAKSALQTWKTERAGLFRESVHLQDV